jgi:hypothetical protein
MAKKDKKKKDKQKGSDAADAVAAVRSAVERTFQATTEGASGKRLVDEITHAAARVRETIDDLKILEDVKALRAEIEALARRVASLEIGQRGPAAAPSRPAPSRRAKAKRSPAKRSSTAKRAPAKRSSSKPAAKRAASTRAKAKSRAKAKPRAKRASS